MKFGASREFLQRIMRPAHLIGGVALLVVVACSIFADTQNRELQDQSLRSRVVGQVRELEARLAGNINGNLTSVTGLIATLTTEPDMTQARFASLAAPLFNERSLLREIAAAPDLKIALLYPLAGNEQALGLDYATDAGQRAAALQARDTGIPILSVPVDLIQGGLGFVSHFPIILSRPDGTETVWGLLSAVIDAPRLYEESGLLASDFGLDVALYDGDAAVGETPFFGDAGIRLDQPIIGEVALPVGSWTVFARPKGGWAAALPSPWPFRLLVLLADALVLIPLILAGRLIEERQRHIRALDQREHQLTVLSRRLGLALETSEIGVWEINLDTAEVVWDQRMRDLFGLPPDSKAGVDAWRAGIHPDDLPWLTAKFEEAIRNRGRYVAEHRIRRPDGSERTIRSIAACYRDENDGSYRMVGCNWDVSEDVANKRALEQAKVEAEARNDELVVATARIEHTSLHDALTGLPNRRYLDQVLAERAETCRRTGAGLALLHIDLDRFKQLNDTLGHGAGDSMLVHVARLLHANVRDEDFVARIGGDEFVIVSDQTGRRELGRLATRLAAQTREPILYQGHECRCGVSIGVAYQRGDKVDDKRLLIDADIALYRAKRRGRNRFEFFTEALQAEIMSTKQMADEILAGLEQDQFVAWYQPQFDARTGAVCGVEALARWTHPVRGLLSPDVFLHIAEDLNVVETIDRMMLEQTLGWMQRWRQSGVVVPRASVNVSGRRLRDDTLIRGLKKLDIPPGTISFELVESIYLDESDDMVAWNIDQIRDLGIDIEIDDFGTGYASIVSLLKLRPRRMKIDRQLVTPVLDSDAQRGLVASIVDIGHSLGIDVVAEGVESMEQARLLTELGCDVLQGYALSKPLPAEDIGTFVRKRQPRAA